MDQNKTNYTLSVVWSKRITQMQSTLHSEWILTGWTSPFWLSEPGGRRIMNRPRLTSATSTPSSLRGTRPGPGLHCCAAISLASPHRSSSVFNRVAGGAISISSRAHRVLMPCTVLRGHTAAAGGIPGMHVLSSLASHLEDYCDLH
jgi:hypothetical protein